jgi:4-hydroxythreonine-4-phosphate dehydrogenase
MRAKFGIAVPRIAVCGRIPHAGEGGYLGAREIDVIQPVIARMADGGLQVIRTRTPRTRSSSPSTRKHHDAILRCSTTGLPV